MNNQKPVAWANWKVDTLSYVPYRTKEEAQRSVEASEISATQLGPYRVVPLYDAPVPPQGDAQPVAWRGLNAYGEVVTEWVDGAPPAQMFDLCGNPASYDKIESAYANPDAGEVARLTAERDALQLRLNAADQLTDELTVPAGYCLMPTSLTAENGAKALLMGEFSVSQQHVCPECATTGEAPDDDCDICEGLGSYTQHTPISWDTMKEIYSKVVGSLAKTPNTPQ